MAEMHKMAVRTPVRADLALVVLGAFFEVAEMAGCDRAPPDDECGACVVGACGWVFTI